MSDANSEPTTIDDAIPTPEGAPWTAFIECQNCGYVGQMYATDRPRETQLWECKECGDETIHETLLIGEGSGDLA